MTHNLEKTAIDLDAMEHHYRHHPHVLDLIQRLRALERVREAAQTFEEAVWQWMSAEPGNEAETSGAMDDANERLKVALAAVEQA